MYSANLDLLRATSRHHLDGQPKDPHAHHRADLLAARRALRLGRLQAAMTRLLAPLHRSWVRRAATPVAREADCR